MLSCKNFASDRLEALNEAIRSQPSSMIFITYHEVSSHTIPNMAPRMGPYQHALVEDLLRLKATRAECASTASCTTRSITAIRRNLRIFGSTQAPPNGESGQFLLSNRMIVVILIRLEEKPTLFSNELQWLIYDIFSIMVSRYIIF